MSVGFFVAFCMIAVVIVDSATDPDSSPCDLLDDAFSKTANGTLRPAREMSVYGEPRWVSVYSDGRALSRAAAALFVAVARHGLRYSRLKLIQGPKEFCALADMQQNNCHQIDSSNTTYDNLIIVPAISWNGERCESAEVCKKREVVPLRLQIVSGGAAPAAVTLHVRLSTLAAADQRCVRAQNWTFYQNQTELMQCGFFRDNSTEVVLFTLTEWANITNDLAKRISPMFLNINFVPLDSDVVLRQRILDLFQDKTESFLFLDYDIWQNEASVYTVQPPPQTCTKDDCFTMLDSMRSLKIADVFALRELAPELLAVFRRFSPTSSQLKNVLEIEASHEHFNTTDAACSWALNNTSNFKSWLQVNYTKIHWIVVFICIEDPEKDAYIKVSELIKSNFSTFIPYNIGIYYINVNCTADSDLNYKLNKVIASSRWPKLIGAVATGAGTQMAVEYASIMETALILYDIPLPQTKLEPAARSVTGNIRQLAKAIRHFLKICKWSRLAVISDNTDMSNGFFEAIKEDKKLKLYNIELVDTIIKLDSITNYLQTLKNMNARIVFVNTTPIIAQMILCAANDLDMTPSAGYAWILREWRSIDLNCNNSLTLAHMNHFTLSYWWQGGDINYTSWHRNNENSSNISLIMEQIDKLWEIRPWPPLATSIVDALLLLVKSFNVFSQKHPGRLNDLHGNGTVRLLLESIEKEETSGLVQTFSYINGTLKMPLIFLNQWYGKRCDPIAMWQISEEGVNPKIQIRNIYDGDPPADGSRICLTTSNGNVFQPNCHDYVWFTTAVCILLAVSVLYISWKVRYNRLARHDSILMAQLSAQRELVRSELADHFVDRTGLELYHDLGKGCFGRVRYGILRAPGRQFVSVAVKELREDVAPVEEQELLREAITLSTLSHDHVVRLIGVCTSGGPLLVLMEYAFFGNLREYLSERRHLADCAVTMSVDYFDETFHVSAIALTRLAKEAASALEYLTLQRLVHRDIRASNCLVDARRSLKLADFGLARKTGTGASGDSEEYACRRRGLFPVLWMAPESLERGVFTAASDAWALGVLLLELLTLGARPYATWPPLRVLRYVTAGGHPPLPADISPDARRMLLGCWQRAPEDRWSAAAVRCALAADAALLRPTLLPPVMPATDDALPGDINALADHDTPPGDDSVLADHDAPPRDATMLADNDTPPEDACTLAESIV